jgi:hypothetical protein
MTSFAVHLYGKYTNIKAQEIRKVAKKVHYVQKFATCLISWYAFYIRYETGMFSSTS